MKLGTQILMFLIFLLCLISIGKSFGQLNPRDNAYYESAGAFKNPEFAEQDNGWTFEGCALGVSYSVNVPFSAKTATVTCVAETLSIKQCSTKFASLQNAYLDAHANIKVNATSSPVYFTVTDGTNELFKTALKQDNEWHAVSAPPFFPSAINCIEIKSDASFTGTVSLTQANIKQNFNLASVGYVKEESGWENKGTNTFTASSTNPDKGIANVDSFRCRRDGTDLLVEINYEQVSTTGSSAGTGAYFLPFPDSCAGSENLEIDTDFITQSGTLNVSGKTINSSGSFYSDSLSISGKVSVSVRSAINKELTLTLHDVVSGTSENWGSVKMPMNTGLFAISVSYRVPIKQWKQSTISISQKSPLPIEFKSSTGGGQSIGNGTVTFNIGASDVKKSDGVTFNDVDDTITFNQDAKIRAVWRGVLNCGAANNMSVFYEIDRGSGFEESLLRCDTRVFVNSQTDASECSYTTKVKKGDIFRTRLLGSDAACIVNTAYPSATLQIDSILDSPDIFGMIKESNIKKDVDQFPLVETAWGVYRSKTYYRKCFTSLAGNGSTVVSGVTELKDVFGNITNSNSWELQGQANFPVWRDSGHYAGVVRSGSSIVVKKVNNLNVSTANYCVEYTKD